MVLPWDQYTFYCIDLCVSSVNVIVLILVIILFYSSNTYHRNLKILILNLSVSFMCIALSNFLTALSTLFREPSAAADYAELEEALAAMSNYGMNLAPLTFLAIIIERTMATKYSRVYEHVEHVCYTGTLVVACHGGVFAMAYFFNYRKSAFKKQAFSQPLVNVNYYLQVAVVFFMDGVTIITLIALYQANKRLRNKTCLSDIDLSQRYQITENIRAVYILLPLIVVGVMFSVLGMTASAIQNWFDSTLRIRIPVYHLVMNCYVTIGFLILLRQDRTFRERFLHAVMPCKSINHSSVAPEKVRNVYGRVIIDYDSAENHFETLKKMWA